MLRRATTSRRVSYKIKCVVHENIATRSSREETLRRGVEDAVGFFVAGEVGDGARTARSRSAAAALVTVPPFGDFHSAARANLAAFSIASGFRSPAPMASSAFLSSCRSTSREESLEVIEVEDHRRRLFAGLARARADDVDIRARAPTRSGRARRRRGIRSTRRRRAPDRPGRRRRRRGRRAPRPGRVDPPGGFLDPPGGSLDPPGGSLDPPVVLFLVRIAAFRVASTASCFFFNVANTSGSLSVLFILHARQEASPASSGLASSASARRARSSGGRRRWRGRGPPFSSRGPRVWRPSRPRGTQPTVMMWPSPGFGRSLAEAKCGASVPGGLFGGVTS